MRWVVVLVNRPAKLDRRFLDLNLVDAIEGRIYDRLQVWRTLVRLPGYVNSKYFASASEGVYAFDSTEQCLDSGLKGKNWMVVNR